MLSSKITAIFQAKEGSGFTGFSACDSTNKFGGGQGASFSIPSSGGLSFGGESNPVRFQFDSSAVPSTSEPSKLTTGRISSFSFGNSTFVSSTTPIKQEQPDSTSDKQAASDFKAAFSFKFPELNKKSEAPKPAKQPFQFGSAGSTPTFGTSTSVFRGSKSSDDGKTKSGSGLLERLLSEPSKEAEEPDDLSLSSSSPFDDDVVIVGEQIIPKDKLKEARQWKLPDAFYLYETRPPCKGCLGCLSETFDFNTIGKEGTVKLHNQTTERKQSSSPLDKASEISTGKPQPPVKTDAGFKVDQ